MKMWYTYIHTHIYTHNGILTIKNEILPFAGCNVDRFRKYYAWWNRERQIMNDTTYMYNIKQNTNIYNSTDRYRKQTTIYQWWEGREVGKIGYGIKRYKLLHIK